jgi:hypothetical protein
MSYENPAGSTTDVETPATDETSPAGDDTTQAVDPSAAISRGKGLSLESIVPGSEADKALQNFKELDATYKSAEAAFNAAKDARNAGILALKDEHNVGFSAIADTIGNTSSLVLYLYQRAQGMTAKEIREASIASNAAKQANRVSDPNRKPVRKQSSAEKELRKAQREALRAFLEQERANAAAAGESTDEIDAELATDVDDGDEG